MSNNRLAKNTFKKCDLHIHSSSCYSRHYSKEAFEGAILESDLDVVAITDHNSVDVELLQELATKMEERNKTLLAGVELNLKLQEATISRYELQVPDNNNYFHAIVLCSIENAAVFSAAVDRLFGISDADRAALTSGALTRKNYSKKREGEAIYLEDMQRALDSIPHFFIPHENKSDRNLSDYLPSKIGGNYCKENDGYKDRLFYYSSSMAVEGGEDSRKHIAVSMAECHNTTIAALLFSDATKVEEIGLNSTWIDFDGDLDSLLLAISDPESRIRTSDEFPSLPQTNTHNFIESISFDAYPNGKESTPQKQELHFAPGYNGIVGSRGSGKSMLAHILAKQDLETYGSNVDADSIRFKTANGQPSANRPNCLYLAQGDLEQLFRNENYYAVPFLEEELRPLQDEARNNSEQARTAILKSFKDEQSGLEAFMQKYPAGAVCLDFLDNPIPAGISIQEPEGITINEETEIERAVASLNEALGHLQSASEAIKQIELKEIYPENQRLFITLSGEVQDIQTELQSVAKRTELLKNTFERCTELKLFDCRSNLIKLFHAELTAYNRKEDAVAKSEYESQAEEAKNFLLNMLQLRVALGLLSNQAEEERAEMVSPIQPEKRRIGSDEIEIAVALKNRASIQELANELVKKHADSADNRLVRACLMQSEPKQAVEIFNRKKIMPQNRESNVADYIRCFYEKLGDQVGGEGELEVQVSFNGVSLDTMSPGSQAEVLLKLFLNDELATGKYTYVVLDQPEDNLDAGTIKDFLVTRIKELKLDVQLFVVSHSAPVIVNGDARIIIVSRNDENNGITYRQGTLTDADIKQSVADVLDGGERYLKMRLNKYNFKVSDRQC